MPGRNDLARSCATLSVAGAALCAGVVFSTSAFAGAFAVREQSAYYQGMSFAGAAAGDDLSAMFWNSAAAASAPGINTASHLGVVFPQTEIEATGGDLAAVFAEDRSGMIGDQTVVPASYANYQIDQNWFVGLALNGAFGFATKPENREFAGTPIADSSRIFSLTINPNIAYKITDTLTVGVGVQALYADVRLTSGKPDAVNPGFGTAAAGLPDGRQIDADDWAVGATAGVIWQPMPGTRIGVGYRSNIHVEAEGRCKGTGLSNASIPATCGTGTDIEAELTLPDMITASFSHLISDRWKVLGTVEWANWSRVPAVVDFTNDNGDVVDVFPLDYEDGWFFSGGVEYAWRPGTILRAGVAYEISPIDDDIRNVSLPDDDRIWVSAGFTTQLTGSTRLDFGYSHLFIDDSPITFEDDIVPAIPGPGFVGEATGDIDIVTVGITHNWGGPEPALEPLK
jgi:long-chain fatty acid transport protein